MTRSPDYDSEAADLVARTLRAVALDTDVALRDEAPVPVASLPAPIDLGAHRHRRVTRTVAATAAAAAVLVAALVWAGRNPSDPSGPAVTGDLGTTPGTDAPEGDLGPIVPPLRLVSPPAGFVEDPQGNVDWTPPVVSYATLLRRDGDAVVAAVVNWPDGEPAAEDELDVLVQSLARVTGATGTVRTTLVPAESAAYITLPLDDVDPEAVIQIEDAMVPEGPGPAADFPPGWTTEPVVLDWVPDASPTTAARFTGPGDRQLDLYTVAAAVSDLADVPALVPGAEPFLVGDLAGWQATVGSESVFVWQAAPGIVGVVITDEATAAEVPGMVASMPPWSPGGSQAG
jgi:hypothetical protein